MALGLYLSCLLAGCSGSQDAVGGTATDGQEMETSIYRGDIQRSGVYVDGGTPTLSEKLWEYRIRDLHTWDYLTTPPAAAEGLVFFGTSKGLYALDANTGKLEWTVQNSLGGYGLTVSNGTLYYRVERSLHAVDIRTRQEKWVFTAGEQITGSPVIHDGTVYFGGDAGYLYAVEVGTGVLKWKSTAGDRFYPHPYVAAPAIADGRIYFTGLDDYRVADVTDGMGNIYAVDLQTGLEAWKFVPPGSAEMPGSVGEPVVYDGVVYCISEPNAYIGSGYVYALDSRTGKELWKFAPASAQAKPLALAAADGLLYIVAYGPSSSFITDNGRLLRWTQKQGRKSGPLRVGITLLPRPFQMASSI